MSGLPLFKGDGWDIYDGGQDMYPHRDLVIFANHRTCRKIGSKDRDIMNSWWLGDLEQRCILCEAKVPDNIQALVTLYVYGKETP